MSSMDGAQLAPGATPMEKSGSRLSDLASSQEILNSLDGLFAAHEVRVLGVVGILTGYICTLLVKVLHIDGPLDGVYGIMFIAALLMSLDPNIAVRSLRWWSRGLVVVIMSVVITSPQIYNSWTVAFDEDRATALAALAQKTTEEAQAPLVQGTGSITQGQPQ